MRVVCISEYDGWDSYGDTDGITKGNIYTVIEECNGYGRFKWWPFPVRCYELVGFPEYNVFPCNCFVEINENEIDEMELVNTKEIGTYK